MANYKAHSTFNLLLILPLAAWGVVHFFNPTHKVGACFIATFAYSTLFMSPDVDLANQNKLLSIKGILTLPFRLYSRLFAHRGLSHIPIIGTVTRLAYLGAIALLAYYVMNKTLPSMESLALIFQSYDIYILYGLAGIVLADIGHLILDLFS
ncbi:MAG: hypothetical protein SP1CHLAM54_05880 [Chlamydiia bacterium]|nr:hypothetical protein [Chlamydiia bacterium]MCH9615498.1 hypothetical protein [Chlamydiia bacterium]MCH9629153.1 hypothetical protein [Chlamydiia bacterium]